LGKQFFDKFNIDGQVVELKDIDANITMLIGCISIKGYGVVFFDLNNKEVFETLKVFKHEYTIGIVTTGHSIDNFNVGVLIDNQSDENVKEFFVELTYDSLNSFDKGDIMLSRVFISSEKVQSVQADSLGLVTVFLIGTNAYIVPNSIYGLNNLPIYVYKNTGQSMNIGFIHVNTFQDNVIMFKLVEKENEEDEVVAFHNKPEDIDSFKCAFKKQGNYVTEITKQFLHNDYEINLKYTKFSFKINSNIDPKDDKGKKDEDKKRDEDKKKDEERRKREEETKRQEEERRRREAEAEERNRKEEEERRRKEEEEERKKEEEEQRKREEQEKAKKEEEEERARKYEERSKKSEEEWKKSEEERQRKEKEKKEKDRKKDDEKNDINKPTHEDSKNSEESSNTALIIIIIVVSIVLIGVIAIVLYLRRKKRESSSGIVLGSGHYQLPA
jgi:hypothetical protein